MKLKYLFLSMLGAAVFVGCNNEIGGGIDGPNGEEADEYGGVTTTATFEFNTKAPSTYGGDGNQVGVGNENIIGDAALFIYKIDGTPEAMAYVANAASTANDNKVTVKCKSGDKLIYLAVNIGGNKLIKAAGLGATPDNSVAPDFLGVEWSDADAPYFDKYNNAGTGFERLNAAIWAQGANAIAIQTENGFTPTSSTANALILALSGNGDPADGVGRLSIPRTLALESSATNRRYLMTNWGNSGSANVDDPNTGSAGGTIHQSTCKFTLAPYVSADSSRTGTASIANIDKRNSLLINVQRALAKIGVKAITQARLDAAGTPGVANPTNGGRLVILGSNKWAAGNINRSEYPFQMFDQSRVVSTRYRDTAALVNTSAYPVGGWELKLDNSRFEGASQSYKAQNLTTTAVIAKIASATGNVEYNNATSSAPADNFVYVPELNNYDTYNHYSPFVVLAGEYKPNSYITAVNSTKQISTVSGAPASTPTWVASSDLDTLYFVRSSFGDQGLFFHGMTALRQYVSYILGINNGSSPLVPTNDITTDNYINSLRASNGNVQADLQTYYRGQCFYRIWITDSSVSQSQNKRLVRRNHIYEIEITSVNGPGIGDPNDIIDPHPEEPEPLEEADTYVTATINVVPWHVVNQQTEIDIN